MKKKWDEPQRKKKNRVKEQAQGVKKKEKKEKNKETPNSSYPNNLVAHLEAVGRT